jgi:hypothetical protein
MWECAAVLDERSCVLFTSLTGTVAILVIAGAQSQFSANKPVLECWIRLRRGGDDGG